MTKGKIIIIVLAILVIGAGIYAWTNRKVDVKWKTAAVEQGPIEVLITATGSLQCVDTVDVGTQVSGTIANLYADFNSTVKKGQVIAVLDTTLLHSSLLTAQAQMDQSLAQEIKAKADMDRAKPLFEKGLIAQSDMDLAVQNDKVAEANLASTKAGVQSARIDLSRATIVSPINGTVISRAVNVGQTVAASFSTPTLFSIANDLRKMRVIASVDEADIGQVKVGQPATFTVDAYPDTEFDGTVSQIRLQPITNQNVVTYNVLIDVNNPALKLMPGMTANLSIITHQKDNVLLVPVAALSFMPARKPGGKGAHSGNGGWKKSDSGSGETASQNSNPSDDTHWQKGHVFVLQNGKPKFVRLRVGLSNGSKSEVQGELSEGDSVIVGMESGGNSSASTAKQPFGMQQQGGMGGGGGRGFR